MRAMFSIWVYEGCGPKEFIVQIPEPDLSGPGCASEGPSPGKSRVLDRGEGKLAPLGML